MKRTFKYVLSVVAVMLCLSSVASASTIVKWGAQGGDTGIVTSSGSGQNSTPSTYAPATLYNPASPNLGYNDVDSARCNKFGGAATANQNNNFVNNAAGDYIQLLANMGAFGYYEGMLAWNGGAGASGQSAFLTSDEQLESFHVEFKQRSSDNNPVVSFLLETTAGWYISDQTATNSSSTYTVFDKDIADLTWTGYGQFGVTAGAGTAPDTADIVSVGLYLEDTNGGGNFSGGYIRNFEVTANSTLVTWDGSTDTTWTGPSDTTSWSGATYDDGDDAQFLGSGASAVTVSGTVNPSSITVNASADYTFSGGVISSAANGLTKSGSGTLTLSGADTYTGTTTIDGGTLLLSRGAYPSTIPTNTYTINNGGTLSFGNHTQLRRYVGEIPDVVVNSGGAIDSSSTVTLFENITLNGGTMQSKGGFSDVWGSFVILDTVTVTADSLIEIAEVDDGYNAISPGNFNGARALTFDVSSGATLTNELPIIDYSAGNTYSLVKDGDGTLKLSDNANGSDYSGTTTIDGGTLLLSRNSNPTAVPQGAITINNGGTLAFGTFNQLSKDGTIPDVVVNSGGVIDSSATVTTFDSITLNGGSLQSKGGFSSAWGSFVVLDDVTVTADSLIEDVSGSDNLITPGQFNGNRTLTFDVSDAVTLTNELGIADYNSGTYTYSIIKDGNGTVVQANAESNSYSGTLTVSDGTLTEVASGDGTAASLNVSDWTRPMSGTTIADGAKLVLDTSSYTDNRSRVDVGEITIASGATLEFAHDSSNLDVDKFILTGGSFLGDGAILKTGSAYADIAWAGSGASLDNFNGLINVSEGTLAANPGNVGTSGSGNANLTVAAGAAFDVRSGTFQMDSLNGAGDINNSSGTGSTLSLGNNNGSGSFSGQVLAGDVDGLSLVKNGSGTQTLANAENNTYTGATTINGGTLVEQTGLTGGTWTRATSSTTIESGGRLVLDTSAQSNAGSRQNVGTITINSGGYLELTNTASSVDRSIWSAGSILGSGTLVKSGPGHQDIAWSGSKTSLDSFAGAISIDDGYLIINPNAGVVAGSGNFDVTVDATLDIRTGTFKIDSLDGAGTVYESDTGNTSILWLGNNNGDGNFSGSIQNDIRVLKNGSGTQTLSGANTTTGYLTINEGVLALAAGGSLSEETVVRIYSGAQMDLANGIDQTVASLYLDGVLQGKGTFGAIGSGADNESNYFSGSGILRLPPVGSVFKFK